MKKHKRRQNRSISALFTAHPWLKLISLILAVMIWFYVKQEIGVF